MKIVWIVIAVITAFMFMYFVDFTSACDLKGGKSVQMNEGLICIDKSVLK